MNTTSPVLVTGATGYVAGWIVKNLLERGFVVHATARNLQTNEQVNHLRNLANGMPGTLRIFEADLLKVNSFKEAMAGCDLVFHTASPFRLKVNDPQKDLIEPALAGTRNVLESVGATPSVRRAVLTSSVAAIIGDVADLQQIPGGRANETHWNHSSSLTHQPYSYSKTIAEREAWKICQAQTRWQMVAINPSLVVGPGLFPNPTSESFNLIRQLGDGSYKSGVPDFSIGLVDVRDVAEAHLLAAFDPQATGRYIISARTSSLLEIAGILRTHFGKNIPFPSRLVPKALIWLLAPAVGVSRRMVRRNMAYPWAVDHARSLRLGMHYRPVEPALIELFSQLVEAGLIFPGGHKKSRG